MEVGGVMEEREESKNQIGLLSKQEGLHRYPESPLPDLLSEERERASELGPGNPALGQRIYD